ncbi:MAG TPA: outer membrane protein assembly factor BamD [bacterium (Candidatus Stahlbacteria)]|nr:outer membrane protein assembly factor BamD [Candidatus Stahlbacteria bacterium]
MFIFVRVFCVYIILICGAPVFARDLALELADWLLSSECYKDAITEYKRFIFFNPTSDSVSYAYYKIGLAYRNVHKWTESLHALQQAIQTASSDSIRDERKIALAVTLIASRNYSAAEFELLKVELFSQFESLKKKAAFFRGISTLYTFKWDESRDAFDKYFNATISVGRRVDSLLAIYQQLRYKSPKLAKLLSTILPGAGQIYVGDWRNGINALAINMVTGYLLADALLKRHYNDALFSFLWLFQRYYLGNRHHAEEIAQNYNLHLNQLVVERILQNLLLSEDEF